MLSLFSGCIYVEAVSLVHFDIKFYGNQLTAGRNNTLIVNMTNVKDDVYDVLVTLTISSPLILSIDNNWRYTSIKKHASVQIEMDIYAPDSAVKSTFFSSLVITYKEIGYLYYTSETHTIGLVVFGWLDMIAYGVTTDPKPVAPGSKATISANLLNRGNVAAMYTNVTIMPREPFITSLDSSSYIGQVDPNSPAPFTVSAQVDWATKNGTYPVEVLVTFQDDRHIEHSLIILTSVEVALPPPKPPPPSPSVAFIRQVRSWIEANPWIYLATGLVLVASIALYIRGRRRRRLLELLEGSPTRVGTESR